MNKLDEYKFLVTRAEADGCYVCDAWYDMQVDLLDSMDDVISLLRSVLDKEEKFDYPLTLSHIDYDGEVTHLSDFKLDAGCLSGLKGISFKYNGNNVRLKR